MFRAEGERGLFTLGIGVFFKNLLLPKYNNREQTGEFFFKFISKYHLAQVFVKYLPGFLSPSIKYFHLSLLRKVELTLFL